jgi:hypothetical protein
MNSAISKTWVKTGMICGFLALIIYPTMMFVSLPVQLMLVLACSFGFLLMIASIGLYYFISLNKKTVSLRLGVLFNIIGCAVVTMMFTIQLALFQTKLSSNIEAAKEMKNYIFQFSNTIQLGLDVVWDIFFGVGTVLLALNMFRHPRYGKVFSISGTAIALALLVFNIYSFPVPPAESGSIDLGPFVALWYLAVTIRIAMSFKWVDESIAANSKMQPY